METAIENKDKELFNIYHCSVGSCRMITREGKVIIFDAEGKTITNSKEVIDYLDAEMVSGHPHLSVKEGEERVSADELDPMVAFKKKVIAEHIESQRAANKEPIDPAPEDPLALGSVSEAKLTPASSALLASLAKKSNT